MECLHEEGGANGFGYLCIPLIFFNKHHALPMLISISIEKFTKHKMVSNGSTYFLRKKTGKRKRENNHCLSLYSETTMFKTEHTALDY